MTFLLLCFFFLYCGYVFFTEAVVWDDDKKVNFLELLHRLIYWKLSETVTSTQWPFSLASLTSLSSPVADLRLQWLTIASHRYLCNTIRGTWCSTCSQLQIGSKFVIWLMKAKYIGWGCPVILRQLLGSRMQQWRDPSMPSLHTLHCGTPESSAGNHVADHISTWFDAIIPSQLCMCMWRVSAEKLCCVHTHARVCVCLLMCLFSECWTYISVAMLAQCVLVCARVCVCVFLAEPLIWHWDSLSPLCLLRRQLVQGSSHQHDKHHPDQTHAYLLSRGQDSGADQQKKLVHSLHTHRKKKKKKSFGGIVL